MRYKVLTSQDMERLIAEGYTFRQRQLYSKGLPGDIAVYYEPRGPLWVTKTPLKSPRKSGETS